ncbi:MAG: hypothetical protein LBR12_06080, partial [Opitutaceae bacterium]|nr:hypothetical protein [Opitutaceae bacterium]
MPHQPPFLPAQNRRDFLKPLGLVTAAPFVTRGLMAAQAKSTKLRHAAVGVGGMGWRDLTQIADCPGVEIAALCDVDAARLAKAAA